MTRYHKLYRFSATTGKCEDCGLIENHSNACHDAAPVRKIEELYDELDKKNLQNDEMRKFIYTLLVGRVFDDCGKLGEKWKAEAVAFTEKPVGPVIAIGADGDACCAKCGKKDYPLSNHRCESEKRKCEAEVFGATDQEKCGKALPCPHHGDGRCEDCKEPMHYGGKPDKDCGMVWPG